MTRIAVRSRVLVLLFVLAVSSLLCATRADKRPNVVVQPKSRPALVAVISRNDEPAGPANMDAIVLVERGKLRQPYPEQNEGAQKKFGAIYFKTGKPFRVTFGGGEIGSATVQSFQAGCNNIHARASLADNGRLPSSLSALATDSDALGRKASSRRAPTETERADIMKMVRQIYLARGTTPALLKSITTTNLTATDLNSDGSVELIGSFVLATKAKARRDLLLIAEPQKGTATFKAALVDFQSYKLPPEEFDSAKDFIDQLDLDGDNLAEVFVQQHGFDGYAYAIYKKVLGRWRQIYSFIGDAC
jgi:hypothetical protein